jgi:hypothetical protein
MAEYSFEAVKKYKEKRHDWNSNYTDDTGLLCEPLHGRLESCLQAVRLSSSQFTLIAAYNVRLDALSEIK